MASPLASSHDLLESLINHVALPPRLPGKPETRIDQIEQALTARLLDASDLLSTLTSTLTGTGPSQQWDSVRNILQISRSINMGGILNKTTLSAEFHRLKRGDVLILHITAQNAGLLIRRENGAQGESVTFEAFEASAMSEKVLAAENALQWDFPGCAVAIPYSEFDSVSFQSNLAGFLEQASTESIKRFAARTRKAGSFALETRDTVDPALITQMLMTLLEVEGNRIYPPLLRKRVRDDVCWTDGAELPWRRCPFWLVLRVGLQRHLCKIHGNEVGRVHYKFLVSFLLAQLMDEIRESESPELLSFLKAKLGRRLSKILVDKEKTSSQVRPVYELMFAALGPRIQKMMKNANAHIDTLWTAFKRKIQRPIGPLARYADQNHLMLTLQNSAPYLQDVLSRSLYVPEKAQSSSLDRRPTESDVALATAKVFQDFVDHYNLLADLEAKVEESQPILPNSANQEKSCLEFAAQIDMYLTAVANSYDFNPEQKSYMILTVMELWVQMDRCATRLFNLMLDYSPGFPSQILDVLQLPRLKDMVRLQEVQEYLKARQTRCHYPLMTLFDDPVEGCFAQRYFDESKDSQRLQNLRQSIETNADLARQRKENEWRKSMAEFEDIQKKFAESICIYTTIDFEVRHDDRQCTKCYLQRKMNRMRIQIHEHPLPSSPVQAKALVFELDCPESFASYRNATWKILSTLAFPKLMSGFEPRLVLCNYSGLEAFAKPRAEGVSLASTTKSFLSTHYRGVRFPASLDDVCLPNGLKLGYFDTLSKVWTGRHASIHAQKPTFTHHCQLTPFSKSPFAQLLASPDFAADSNGPSSYEIIASQTRCPSGLNINEFLAFQTLFCGKYRQWFSILVELGSSNLNFSTEVVTSVISMLALQAGPPLGGDPLRTTHRVFHEATFCERLIEQIGRRLDGLSSNWRETHCMDMLITLILRLCSLAAAIAIGPALRLLEKARAITLDWIRSLRVEIRKAADVSTSQRCVGYAFWAALLCRRTFAVYVEGFGLASVVKLHPLALRCFFESSIALQNNLESDPATLPALSRNALVRDLKMASRLRSVLRRSLEVHPESLGSAIDCVWPQHEGSVSRDFSQPKFLESPMEWWVRMTVRAAGHFGEQFVNYHLLEGHLLVDGQPLGRLPAKHRESVVLEQLFGTQNLQTYPSSLYGMTYVLAFAMNGHQIHLGFRNNALIVRACIRNTVLELIPSWVFGVSSNFDLPASLVENCVHWLDLRTGVLEIRQKPDIWVTKPSNWLLDFNARMARRRQSSLVDPQSRLFQQVAQIFDRFEYRARLTVYQPERGPLCVELRRLELSFFVNPSHLLECRQLRSEIDPSQDAGTWYGLNSKLVLRDAVNPQKRSVIVPMGPISYKRDGFHVEINLQNKGSYGRFVINDVVGRLDCPTEPRLLYLKAQLHAYTSFIVPDPLTGRTGTEEALHILGSGYCQPWAPLNPGPFETLRSIATASPKREYYPKDMKHMQQVFWDPQLTVTIQNGGFRPIVEAICKKSKKLSLFGGAQAELPSLAPAGEPHLLRRSYVRRCLYQRPSSDFNGQQAASDVAYDSRDRRTASQARLNVFEIVSLIRRPPSAMRTSRNVAGILEKWHEIGGYDTVYDKVLLNDLLDVQFALQWGPLVNLCRTTKLADKYRLIFLFAVMAFNNDVEMDVVRTLGAFVVLEDLKTLEPPAWPSYVGFRRHQTPSVEYLLQFVKPYRDQYPGDARNSFQSRISPKLRRKLEAAELAHEQRTEADCKILVEFLLKHWPCPEPSIEGLSTPLLLDISEALKIVKAEWLRLFQNMELSHYIQHVQRILDCHRSEREIEPPKLGSNDQRVLSSRPRGDELPGLSEHLLSKTMPLVRKEANQVASNKGYPARQNGDYCRSTTLSQVAVSHMVSPVSCEIQELQGIIEGIANSPSTVQQQYAQDMILSLRALKTLKAVTTLDAKTLLPSMLSEEILRARKAVRERFDELRMAFEENDLRAPWLQQGALWPCITPVTLLQQLRSTSAPVFGDGMKESLVAYGVSITTLQRLLRIEDAHLKDDRQKELEEQKNLGHENWQPREYPDWLLLEIDANILIRPGQCEVALATISPPSGSNSVLQMNMGQGKTSCIMPMVATVLADTKKLLRVVVPKPLLLQTAQLLQTRLGGLLGRELTHIPFSRKTPTDLDHIKTFFNIHKQLQASSGVIIALPEHVLSFYLSGLQRLSDAHVPEATGMVKIQAWMSKNCRDVLDECDVSLAVRTQLIYPSGSQTSVHGHPHRWLTSEMLLRLVEGHVWNLQQDFPHSIEVVQRSQGGFPMVYFLRKDVEDALVARLVEDIVSGKTSIIQTKDLTLDDRLAVKWFISEAMVDLATVERVRQMFPSNHVTKQAIYLLRGLLVHRILLLTLKKRWNVQYGLHPKRDPIAVPFYAKGVPSDQAEWGHPDVAILLTCLAFYFGGLDLAQLRQSLEHILKSDDPSSEYDRWMNSSETLPHSLREWNVVNVDDEDQLTEIWRHLRNKVVVIDYFLNHFVFPKHAKQFRVKLQASGWDIPLSLPGTSPKTVQKSADTSPPSLTTGFSGTNDNRTMLPLTVKQADLRGLWHTNAEVLTYLLQPRNRTYVLAVDKNGRHLSERGLLEILNRMKIRMLIDAGAQILEMDNLNLVKAWLKVDHEAPAAVYFNADNKPFVLYRHGFEIPLLASPFADNLRDCLVYLDEAHTRGTDLKMPTHARGALTLSLGQTKDHTVQAAMRLRQLGTTQSVVFFASPEVHQSILDLRPEPSRGLVDTRDVVYWLLKQTCSGIEQLQPLYFGQGVDFCRRAQAAIDSHDFLADVSHRDKYLNVLRHAEHQTLEQLYRPRTKAKSATASATFSPEIAAMMKELESRQKGFQDTGNTVQGSALQEVEQEREVAFEVEAVREVQKPVHYAPLSFRQMHKDIVSFARTGRLSMGSSGYEHVSATLRRTGLGQKHGISTSGALSNFFVSREFMRTVSTPTGGANDNFLRPVNWVLWSVLTNTALVIIPEEAEKLIPLLHDLANPVTYLLTYAAPVTRKMLQFNSLTFYTLPDLPPGWKAPTWLTIELGILAGRLYFEFDEYYHLRRCLGLCNDDEGDGGCEAVPLSEDAMPASSSPASTSSEEHHLPNPTNALADSAPLRPAKTMPAKRISRDRPRISFTSNPLTFLHEWLAVRRKGQDFTHTPMGYVCQGKLLTASHPFFASRATDSGGGLRSSLGGEGGGFAGSVKDKTAAVGEESDDDDDGRKNGTDGFGGNNGDDDDDKK